MASWSWTTEVDIAAKAARDLLKQAQGEGETPSGEPPIGMSPSGEHSPDGESLGGMSPIGAVP
jgi:hypothetical protein